MIIARNFACTVRRLASVAMCNRIFPTIFAVSLTVMPLFARDLPTGEDAKRPYEMVWAGRKADEHRPILPLTDAAGWHVETHNAVAKFERATDRLLFGDGVCRLTYHATGKDPIVAVKPPKPISVPGPFDTITCWVWGQSAYYMSNHSPETTLTANFLDSAGEAFSVQVLHINHHDWHKGWRRLNPSLAARVKNGATFTGFTLTGGTNPDDRSIDLNSFCTFAEELKPLHFAPRAKRPNRVFPDTPAGVNTGNGLLPFPNSPLGVVPTATDDGELEFRLPTKASNWDGLAMRWRGSEWQSVADGGGVWYVNKQDPKGSPVRRAEEKTMVITNRVSPIDVTICGGGVTTRFHQEGKSLVADVASDSHEVAEVRFGAWVNPRNPQRVSFPYYTYGNWGSCRRPGVIVTELAGMPFFHAATMDWTQSMGSSPFGDILRNDEVLASNGGVRYLALTDGSRNVCRERFVYSFSEDVTEVLPNIPNPVSPWKNVTGSGVWRSHGANSDRAKDVSYWRGVRNRGLKHVIVTDHEVCWRDGNESFTFRTEPAPKKGGVKGQHDYARTMIDELGFVYGPYNNFTDFAPVNANWSPDRVARYADGQPQPAWNRCYAPKPLYAVEACAAFTPINQANFGVNTAYCDVHTAVSPWDRTDYDARVPGAGTFAATFYAYGEILLIQKQCWQGPVYSEGGCHYIYCGLADGNYGQDQSYNVSANPWLVDFDLKRMHPLCCNFGMGDLSMFYPGNCAPKNANEKIDRFLAATVAFGHPGYLVPGSAAMEDRSYFMIQALAARYTQAEATEIRYIDEDGKAYCTSAALANGVYRRSQVTVRYSDGTFVAANGSCDRPMLVKKGLWLPPNGYCGWTTDGEVFVFSGLRDGHRVDFAVGPEYVYMDGRGIKTAFPGGEASNSVIRLRERDKGIWPKATADDFAAKSVPPEGMFPPPPKSLDIPMPVICCSGMQVRGREIQPISSKSGAHAHPGSQKCGGISRHGITMHPPYIGGVGLAFMRYSLDVPDCPVTFSAFVGKGDGSCSGDGIFYRVEVSCGETKRKTVASVCVTNHVWVPISADLSSWRGKKIFLWLVADCGPKNKPDGDWSCWGDIKMTKGVEEADGGRQLMTEATPESQGISSAAILRWIDACEKDYDINGHGLAVHGFVLRRHGKVIAEGTWKPFDTLNETHMLYSHSKSFTSTAIGFLVDEGKVDLDERIIAIFPEKAPMNPSEGIRQLRVRDLLTMNAGMSYTDAERKDIGGDWVKAFLANPVDGTPGQKFRYDSCATHVAAAIVEKRSGKKTMDFLAERLFTPLGITGAWTTTSPNGTACGGWGMNMTTRDLAKFGQLYLDRGVWNGKRLLSSEWVAMASGRQTWTNPIPAVPGKGGEWSQGYGFQFWRCTPEDVYRADGAYGQLTIVMPKQDAVLSVHAGITDFAPEFNNTWKYLLPAMGDKALVENQSAQAALAKRCRNLEFKPLAGGREVNPLLNDATMKIAKNDRGISEVGLKRTSDGWQVRLETPAGSSSFEMGYGSWKKGSVRIDAEKYEKLGGLVGTLATSASAAVKKDGTLHGRVYLTGTTACLNLYFSVNNGKPCVKASMFAMGGGNFESVSEPEAKQNTANKTTTKEK